MIIDTPEKMHALTVELARVIDAVIWQPVPAPELEAKGARAYGGTADAWTLLVVVSGVTRNGPLAAGTATRGPQVVYLPPGLAKRAAMRARGDRLPVCPSCGNERGTKP